ncbi:hypothetical protein [Aliterella atlantica]|uniref:Uncharacterized protein n=1 Tax=Aliterella atlantica CENA595 TaxID=1618023 RepID=A0A0D8ZUJ7_9CYAN|nr:hypothetical protein [Aliterella atlantica]KJH70911.1 hypothetical protein UH38_15045 [Aliterella atlantica CENA595]
MTIGILKILATSALLVGVGYILWRSQSPYTRVKCRSKFKRYFNTGTTQTYYGQEERVSIERASGKLQKKLLLLLNGDALAATRLMELAKARNPHKSVNWCAEKVIFDLQRDRGRY